MNETKENNNEESYVLKFPKELGAVYVCLCVVGVLLFILFAWVKICKNPDISSGTFVFAIIVALIGLYVKLYADKWEIIVKEGQLEIHRMLHKVQIVPIAGLEVAYGSKSEMILSQNGKKVITLDRLTVNYDKLQATLADK